MWLSADDTVKLSYESILIFGGAAMLGIAVLQAMRIRPG